MEIQAYSEKQIAHRSLQDGLPGLCGGDGGVSESALQVFTDFVAQVGGVAMASAREPQIMEPTLGGPRRSSRLQKKPPPPSHPPPSTTGRVVASSAAKEVTLNYFYF